MAPSKETATAPDPSISRTTAFPTPPSSWACFSSDQAVLLRDIPLPLALDLLTPPSQAKAVAELYAAMKEFSPQAESTVRIPKDFDTSKFLEAEGHEWGGLYRLEPSPGTEAADSDEGEQLVRLDFILYEQFRMLGGLIDKKFSLVGCQLADPNKGVLFYESYCEEQQLWVRKARTLKEDKDCGTWVREEIVGRCRPWMRWMVEREARRAHREHVYSMHKLFEQKTAAQTTQPASTAVAS